MKSHIISAGRYVTNEIEAVLVALPREFGLSSLVLGSDSRARDNRSVWIGYGSGNGAR